MINPADVTIIIPHYSANELNRSTLIECERSLEETAPDIRRVVAMNPRNDGYETGEIIIKEQGQCKAVNAAVAITNTPWIFVTNDDKIGRAHV